jgi:hypothetical protein
VGEPASGVELLRRLRGGDGPRLTADPARVDTLRARLDESVADGLSRLPEGVVVRVTKGAVRQVLRCEAGHVARLAQSAGAAGPVPAPLLLGRLADHLFALVTLGGGIGLDVVEDCLRAAEADGDGDPRADLAALDPNEQATLRDELRSFGEALVARWPLLPSGAWPRVQERIAVPIADGRVVLSGRLDLVLGGPRPDAAGGAVLDVKAGAMRLDDRQDAGFYALVESLRQGVPPAVSGSYYLRTGEADLDEVDDVFLEAAVRRTAAGAARLVALAGGAEPSATPNGLCRHCPAFDVCPPGQAYVAERDGDGVAPGSRWDDDLGAGDEDSEMDVRT